MKLMNDTSEFIGQKGSLGFKGRQLISGRWEALLDLAIPTPTYFPEKDFLFAFLLCSRLHSPPYQTLSSVFTHFSTPSRQPSNKGGGGGDEEEDDDEGGTTSSRRTQEQESSSNVSEMSYIKNAKSIREYHYYLNCATTHFSHVYLEFGVVSLSILCVR